jgi:hypothetical protein
MKECLGPAENIAPTVASFRGIGTANLRRGTRAAKLFEYEASAHRDHCDARHSPAGVGRCVRGDFPLDVHPLPNC